ncbi:MAG: shikimate dehydrogenase [Alphaproteobacteria bacterium]
MSETDQERRHAITGRARVAGVMGWPVDHSLSPRLHSYWLEQYDIDGAYVPLPVHPDRLEDAITGLRGLGFAGANVTVPHKEAVMPLLASISPTARQIGAVNTLTVDGSGAVHGDNTDAEGYLASLGAAVDVETLRKAVVLGAGGAARAVAVGLLSRGVHRIVLANRTPARAASLAEHLQGLGARVHQANWPPSKFDLHDADLFVNTTSLGMAGQPPLVVSLEGLSAGAVVSDIVYTPLETELLVAARNRGHRVVDGLGMLLHQAGAGFEAWFGVRPEVTRTLRTHVLAALEDRK